jgi:hypothetical protein
MRLFLSETRSIAILEFKLSLKQKLFKNLNTGGITVVFHRIYLIELNLVYSEKRVYWQSNSISMNAKNILKQ